MKNKLIISASGLDRNGIVSEISSIINNYNANIETSRMVRLGEQFTTLILIHIDSKYIGNLKFDLENIKNLNIETISTKSADKQTSNYFQLFINGADNEGIVYAFSKYFEEKSVNIEEVNTSIENAPMSASPLFMMHLIISSNDDLTKDKTFIDNLNKIADRLGVGVDLDKN